jgi:hypothetical protein
MPSFASAGARAVGLAVALIGLLLIGWGLGDTAQSVVQSMDLDLVRDTAAQRTSLITVIAHGLSLVGSAYVIFPLAAACCAVLYRRGAGTNALAIALSTAGGVLIANTQVDARQRDPQNEHASRHRSGHRNNEWRLSEAQGDQQRKIERGRLCRVP